MSDEKVYECPGCNGKVVVKEGEPVPECCGEPMQVCTSTATAEHARFDDDDGPCI